MTTEQTDQYKKPDAYGELMSNAHKAFVCNSVSQRLIVPHIPPAHQMESKISSLISQSDMNEIYERKTQFARTVQTDCLVISGDPMIAHYHSA